MNFITCDGGFTLNELVYDNSKHNQANRDCNSSATDANVSWNCGKEGPSNDEGVQHLRMQRMKCLVALTLLLIGTPMATY